jgi:hypothetical protein
MCDYSLMGIPNRLAKEGENLVVYSFPTHTKGLVSPADLTAPKRQCQRLGFWGGLRTIFRPLKVDSVAAVCIPPGAQLVLQDIPLDIQHSLKLRAVEEVVFTQLTAAANSHRDAVRFYNGAELLLQRLSDGQRIRVLSLDLDLVKGLVHGDGTPLRLG